MAGIGKYKKGAKFTLKSGNSPMFKTIGSSPIMHYVNDVPEHNDGHSDDLQTPEEHNKRIVKDKYWYKINGKKASKAQYKAYKNKPGGDESGKQTNDPNVSLAKQSADKRK